MNINSVKSSRGTAWITEGFSLFMKNPIAWIGVIIIILVIFVVSSLIPGVNLLIHMMLPILFAGLIIGCKEQQQGGAFRVGHLFAGFSHHPGRLILLSVISNVGFLVIMLLSVMLALPFMGDLPSMAELSSGNIDVLQKSTQQILLVLLIGLVLSIPLFMALWFAPVIIVLDNLGVFDAMKQSLKGCYVNSLPFLIYGLLGLIVSIIAALPLFLGWLVLAPVIVTSIYISYTDIFAHSEVIES